MPSRSRTSLLRSFKRLLANRRWTDPARWIDVRLDHQLTQYFPAGGAAVVAFADEMNNAAPMLDDNVRLNPSDVRDAETVGDIWTAEKEKYRLKYELTP